MKNLTLIKTKKILSMALALIVAAFGAPAIAGEVLERVESEGVLTIANKANWAPQSFLNDDNEMDGFDVDVAKEIAQRLGVTAKMDGVVGNLPTMLSAIKKDYPIKILQPLVFYGPLAVADVTNLDQELIQAVEDSDIDAVKKLIEAGANIHIKDKRSSTLLMISIDQEGLEIAKLLITAGVDINAQNGDGWTVLALAAFKDDLDSIKLLMDAGADVHINFGNGFTVLMLASFDGKIETTKLFIDAGVDVNAQNGDGWTALVLASFSGDYDSVKLLVEAGADVNVADKFGQTALILAARESNLEVVTLLVDSGADVNVVTDENQTALDHALGNRSFFDLFSDSTSKYLISKGAKKYSEIN